MNYKVLYRKYRPNCFDDVIGQEYTTKLLRNAIVENRISHAYIFTGPRGTGKTTSARIFAKAINCINLNNGNPCNECDNCKSFNENPDIIEIDAASNNGVDEIRELINNVKLAPSNLKYKVYIIDEFHMLSTSAFNALLLTLEEPPSNVVFILATTDIQNVPITILSRCQRFDFKLISFDDIVKRLEYVSKEEKIKISDDAIEEIAYLSNGGLRDALSYLDQISTQSNKISADDITEIFGSVSNKKIDELISYLNNNKVLELIDLINFFRNNGVNFVVLINKLINKFKDILISIKINKYDGNLLFDDIYNIIIELNKCLISTKSSIDPYMFLEILLLKYVNNEQVKMIKIDDIIKNDDDIHNENNSNDINEESNNKKNTENSDNKEDKNEVINNNIKFDVKIRINNCFVNAKKEYLNNIKDKWDDFVVYESNANKKILSYIMDTSLVAMSDQYGILMNSQESAADLINENIKSLESDFKGFYGLECKFVAISEENWNKSKEEYKNNLKNGIKYSIIEETLFEDGVMDANSSELESLANEIFGDNVEIR